jgi:hypothetical protein
VDVWLGTPFDGGRHVARIRKIDEPQRPERGPAGGGGERGGPR